MLLCRSNESVPWVRLRITCFGCLELTTANACSYHGSCVSCANLISSSGFVARAVQKKTKNDTGLWAGHASLPGHIIHLGPDCGRCRFGTSDTGITSKDYNLKIVKPKQTICIEF